MENGKYVIGDRRFSLEPLAWGQEVWLREEVFEGRNLAGLDVGALISLFRARAPLFLAIILIEDGQTRAQKIMAGLAPVRELAAWMEAHLEPIQVMEYISDFFAVNTGSNLWLRVDHSTPMV